MVAVGCTWPWDGAERIYDGLDCMFVANLDRNSSCGVWGGPHWESLAVAAATPGLYLLTETSSAPKFTFKLMASAADAVATARD
jgi:hypothetical protein